MISNSKILGCRDPRYKHKYLNKGENTLQQNLNDLTEKYDDTDDDESDKHLFRSKRS